MSWLDVNTYAPVSQQELSEPIGGGALPASTGLTIDGSNYGQYVTTSGERFRALYRASRTFSQQFTEVYPTANGVKNFWATSDGVVIEDVKKRESYALIGDEAFDVIYEVTGQVNRVINVAYVFPTLVVVGDIFGEPTQLHLDTLKSLTRQDTVILDKPGPVDEITDQVVSAVNEVGERLGSLGTFLRFVIPLALVALIVIGVNKLV